MADETAVRFGILGCANISIKLSKAIERASNTTLRAIGSRSLEKGTAFAADHGLPEEVRIYGSYEAVVEDDEVDAVYVPLPTGLHVTWAVRAAERGKHVLLEKPVAMNVAELDRILEACEAHGVQFMDGTMWVHHPRTTKMKEALSDAQRFGQLKLQQATVFAMGFWDNGSWTWSFQWRRTILPREEKTMQEFLSFLHQVTLVEGRMDKWIWKAAEEGSYTVKSAFEVMQDLELEEPIPVFLELWKGAAPSNVLAFGWRVFWGRVQTKVNLQRRGIITNGENTSCVFCQETEESLIHLLLLCPFSHQVWSLCHRWLGVLTALPDCVSVHFLQFGNDFRTLKQQGLMKTVWLAIAWSLWLHRNKIVFKNDHKDAAAVIELAQMRAWNWIRVRNKNFNYSIYDWISQPRLCLENL